MALIVLIMAESIRVRADTFGAFAWGRAGARIFSDAYTLLLMLALTISLLRYRLYAADATISRSASYGALTVGLIAVFAMSEKIIEALGERWIGPGLGTLSGALAVAVAAVTIGPLHGRVSRWAEKRFRTELVRLRQGLPLLVGDMRETATPDAIADAVLARVEAGVRARHGAVVLGDAVLDTRVIEPDAAAAWLATGVLPPEAAEGLDTDRGDPLFPVRVPLQADGVGLVGWLLLGPRPDGSFYGREERAALADIADPVARALDIATQRGRRDADRRATEAARRADDEARDREIGRLQQRLGLDEAIA